MTKTPNKSDLLQVQRYVDGELSPAGSNDFEARLREEPSLLVVVEAARAQRRLFRDDPDAQLAHVPVDTVDTVDTVEAVMDQVRRLPQREELMQLADGDELADVAAALGRRWLIAAAVLFVVALLFGTRLLQPMDERDLPADSKELQKLDDRYRDLMNKGEGLPDALRRSGR